MSEKGGDGEITGGVDGMPGFHNPYFSNAANAGRLKSIQFSNTIDEDRVQQRAQRLQLS